MRDDSFFFKRLFIFFYTFIYMTYGSCTNSNDLNINIKSLPIPYNKLSTVLPYHLHGWYNNQDEIESIFHQNRPKIVVELGSWLGLSTCHMAELLQENGTLYAVDHWLGTKIENRPNQAEIDLLLPTLYEQFLSNVIHRKLTHVIVPWRMTTSEAAYTMGEEGITIDLLYIDAAHDERSVYEDLLNWYPLIRNGGVVCGDDWEYAAKDGYPVRKAVFRFIKENRLKLHITNKNFWVFYKP